MFATIRDGALSFFEGILWFFHDLFLPVFGPHSWGWAIIALTLLVRIIILPLAVKQFRSMRAMQALQPQMKALQKKHKVDRELMKKDPEQYRAKKQKLNEEMMALYQREGANPAASCLPLIAQAPIFIALFWTIRGMDELAGAPFYFTTSFIGDDATAQGLAALTSEAGWPGWLLILLMSGTMFLTQKQMMARNAVTQGDDAPSTMAQQQKILLYVMPLFLAVISFNFPLGLLLYWCTTNLWQVAQQAIILREVKSEAASGELADKPGGEALKRFKRRRKASAEDEPVVEPPRKRSPGASSGRPGSSATSGKATGSAPTDDGDDPSAKARSGRNGDGPTEKRDGDGPTKKRDGDSARKPDHQGPARGSTGTNGTSDNGSRGGSGAGATDSDSEPSPTKPRNRDHLPRRGGAGQR